ncbi:MAG: TnpV protein [Oscillospiraceae bacterium]|nr:TnpV protein [Oscillospiraceae bacterium]
MLPNIVLSERKGEHAPFGRYGKMRRAFLKERRPIEYSRLLLSEQLFPHLRTVDEIADERRKNGCAESVIIREIVCEI